jgi:hypothetical protein
MPLSHNSWRKSELGDLRPPSGKNSCFYRQIVRVQIGDSIFTHIYANFWNKNCDVVWSGVCFQIFHIKTYRQLKGALALTLIQLSKVIQHIFVDTMLSCQALLLIYLSLGTKLACLSFLGKQSDCSVTSKSNNDCLGPCTRGCNNCTHANTFNISCDKSGIRSLLIIIRIEGPLHLLIMQPILDFKFRQFSAFRETLFLDTAPPVYNLRLYVSSECCVE